MQELTRRQLLQASLAAGVSVAIGRRAEARAGDGSTPPEIEGPFYPVRPQKDRDFDLTVVEGRKGVAQGQVIFVEGRVVGLDGSPIEDAAVDLWQANAAGRYDHPRDRNPAPIDPNFQGWAIVNSGVEGGFRFKTILPGSYPAARDWLRPPHIHFKISKPGFVDLTTQMYFPGEPLNDADRLLQRIAPDERPLMIAKRIEGKRGDVETFRYVIVLRPA